MVQYADGDKRFKCRITEWQIFGVPLYEMDLFVIAQFPGALPGSLQGIEGHIQSDHACMLLCRQVAHHPLPATYIQTSFILKIHSLQ